MLLLAEFCSDRVTHDTRIIPFARFHYVYLSSFGANSQATADQIVWQDEETYLPASGERSQILNFNGNGLHQERCSQNTLQLFRASPPLAQNPAAQELRRCSSQTLLVNPPLTIRAFTSFRTSAAGNGLSG